MSYKLPASMDLSMNTRMYRVQAFDSHSSPSGFTHLDCTHFPASLVHEGEIYGITFPRGDDHEFILTDIVNGAAFYDDEFQSLAFLASGIYHSPNSSASTMSLDYDFQLVQDSGIQINGCQGEHDCSTQVLHDTNSDLNRLSQMLAKEENTSYLLLIGAQAVEAQKWQLVSTAISRLTNLLTNPEAEKIPFNRLALCFSQGLAKMISGDNVPICLPAPMPAFHMLQEITPYVKFPHFTANQAILEASEGQTEVHIIDFDVMEGIQWPPLMMDLALKKNKNKFLRITVVVDETNTSMVMQTGRRLTEFAESINLPFKFDKTAVEEDQGGQLRGIRLSSSSILIANCIINQLHAHSRSLATVSAFLKGVARLSPKRVILGEEKLFHCSKVPSMTFMEFFCEALQHYSAVQDSLITSLSGGHRTSLKFVEKEIMTIKVSDCLSQFSARDNCRDDFSSLKGYRPIPMSTCNVNQAKLLVGLFHGGFRVQYEKCILSLCWKESIWVLHLHSLLQRIRLIAHNTVLQTSV